MKFDEIKDLSNIELVKRINEKKNNIFQLKMKHSLGQLANPLSVRTERRELAQFMTALQQANQQSTKTAVTEKES